MFYKLDRSLIAATLLILAIFAGCRREDVDQTPPNDSTVTAQAATPTVRPAVESTEPANANVVNLPLTLNGKPPTAEPSSAPALPTPSPTKPVAQDSGPADTPTPDYPVYSGPPIDRDKVGVQVHLHREDLGLLMSQLRELGVGWVKVQVSWKIYQPAADRYDDYRFGELDRFVAAASESGIEVMLGVAKAPEWTRPTTELDGPPSDDAHFQAFMNMLASRYRGRVTAYELWNESNLQREWNGFPLSAADVVALISAGAAGVRAADPGAILVSGAPAPTGINDGTSAIDDRIFLQRMLDAGLAGIVDAVGAHPYGWANPPDSTAAAPDPSVPSHNDHPSFFFYDTLRDYRAILDGRGYPEMELWVTEFGWGTFDGLGRLPPEGAAFMSAVSEKQQAEYTLRSYEIAAGIGGIGPMILWNLNFGPRLGADYTESSYSLLRPDGSLRPVYLALSTIAMDR